MPDQRAPMSRPSAKLPDALRREVLSEQECTYCSDRIGPFEVDHIRPASRGGNNDRTNLTCACVACNTQKRAMFLHEWMSWRERNGMTWPPVASHATEPIHYQDNCAACERSYYDADPDALQRDPYLAAVPHSMQRTEGGWKCHYRCRLGHSWTCWFSVSYGIGWFSDCGCRYCVACRAEDSVVAT
jgi:hypothetical protein